MASAEYPNKPIRIIVPFPAKGPGDMLAHILAEKLKASWGHDVSIEIRDGINGIIGSAIGAKAAPDGHTLIIAASAHYVNPSIYRTLPFDAFADFTPITLVAGGPNVMVFNAAVPLYSVAEVIAYSKANPGKLRYTSGGHGSPSHLAGELFNMIAGTDLVHVPSHGHAAAGAALSEGKDVQLMFDAIFTCMSHVKQGDWRALAVTTTKRTGALPDIPTMEEAGLAGYEVSPAMGLLAPRGVPKPIVDKISLEVGRIMSMPDVVATIRGFGAEPLANTPEQYSDYIQSEIAKWAKVVKHAGIQMRDLPPLVDLVVNGKSG